MAGGAVSKAAEALAGRIRKHAAHLLQTRAERVSLADGRAWAGRADAGRAAEAQGSTGQATANPVGAGRASVSFEEVARAWYLRPDQLPDEVDTQGLEVTEGYKPEEA